MKFFQKNQKFGKIAVKLVLIRVIIDNNAIRRKSFRNRTPEGSHACPSNAEVNPEVRLYRETRNKSTSWWPHACPTNAEVNPEVRLGPNILDQLDNWGNYTSFCNSFLLRLDRAKSKKSFPKKFGPKN